MRYDVIVTDCDTKHGYEIGKSLALAGLNVIAHYNRRATPFFLSRFFARKVVFRVPGDQALEKILQLARTHRPRVLIPVSNESVRLVSENRGELERSVSFLLPDQEAIRITQDKRRTFEYAESLRVASPFTIYDSYDAGLVQAKLERLAFPVVVKFVGVGETGVRYCNDRTELLATLEQCRAEGRTQPLVQEYVQGRGVGYYAIYDRGKCVYHYTHRRLHEYPATGGSSTFAMTTRNERAIEAGQRILEGLEWHGVAMVEFKERSDGGLILMEVNPKFWGSYALSEKAGLAIALDYYKLACGEPVEKKTCRSGVAFKWRTFDWLHRRDRKVNRTTGGDDPGVTPSEVYHDLTLEDPLVTAAKIFDGVLRLVLKKRNPHAVPRFEAQVSRTQPGGTVGSDGESGTRGARLRGGSRLEKTKNDRGR